MKRFLLIPMLAITLIGCERPENKPKSTTEIEDVDNTGRNVRDRDSATITPFDQSESEADRTITQKIRKSIMADSSLSTNAKNVKIITINGVVTLRGPVSSAREKEDIARKATGTQGVKRIDNQLEVTSS